MKQSPRASLTVFELHTTEKQNKEDDISSLPKKGIYEVVHKISPPHVLSPSISLQGLFDAMLDVSGPDLAIAVLSIGLFSQNVKRVEAELTGVTLRSRVSVDSTGK